MFVSLSKIGTSICTSNCGKYLPLPMELLSKLLFDSALGLAFVKFWFNYTSILWLFIRTSISWFCVILFGFNGRYFDSAIILFDFLTLFL